MLSASAGEARAFGNARGRYATRGSIIIEVTSDDGLKGWGEAWGAAPLATMGYFETVKPFFIGKDGLIPVPHGPGLGIEVDEDRLNQYAAG